MSVDISRRNLAQMSTADDVVPMEWAETFPLKSDEDPNGDNEDGDNEEGDNENCDIEDQNNGQRV